MTNKYDMPAWLTQAPPVESAEDYQGGSAPIQRPIEPHTPVNDRDAARPVEQLRDGLRVTMPAIESVRTVRRSVSDNDQPIGADGASRVQQVLEVPHGSEVELAKILSCQLRSACQGRVVKVDGEFWAYGPTDWRVIPERKMRLAVHKFDGASISFTKNGMLKVGKRLIDGVLHEVGTLLGEPGFFENPAVAVNALNGAVVIEKDGRIARRPHDPDDRFRFTIQASFEHCDDMNPPQRSLLHTLLCGAFLGDPDADDKVKLIGEILGAAAFGMATRVKQPKAFVFLGETASNGKSTIAGLLSCLLPAGSVSSISPGAFGDERRIVNLAGKAANVADELSASAISGETFKAAVTGNSIEGRDLYKSAVTFKPRALHCFTTNTLPRFSGGLDRGLQRRLIVLRFNRTIPENEIIPDILDRIEREELGHLLCFAIAGAQRLIRQGAYTIPGSSHDALREWLMLEPVNAWFAERVCVEKDTFGEVVRQADAYRDFKTWAVEQGYAERLLPAVNTFGQKIRTILNAVSGTDVRRRAGGTVLLGVRLGDNAAADPTSVAGTLEW